MEEQKGNKPLEKFRSGSIEVAVWENTSKDGNKWYSISHKRGYKDADGNWKDSFNYNENDIPVLSLLLDKAYEFVKMHKL